MSDIRICQRWADERAQHLRQIRLMLAADGRLRTADQIEKPLREHNR